METVVTGGAPSEAPVTRSVDALWLDVFQQVSARVAHELRGALNGVSVNLEVVRSRSNRADASAASVAPFASSSADQLELVVAMTEALLLLARAPREPVDMHELVEQLAALLAPSARADGTSLRIELPSRELTGATTKANGNVARLVVGASLMAALSKKGDIRCKLGVGEDIVVHVESVDGEGPLELAPDVLAAASANGVAVHGEEGGRSISLVFPRTTRGS